MFAAADGISGVVLLDMVVLDSSQTMEKSIGDINMNPCIVGCEGFHHIRCNKL
jgi:hypothetical protein